MTINAQLKMKFIFITLFSIIISCSTNQNKTMEKNHLYVENENLNELMTIKPNAVNELEKLLFKVKFGHEEVSDKFPIGYVGLLPEEDRPEANRALNESIKKLIKILRNEETISKRIILNEFESGLESFEDLAVDTEDRERVCYYYEEIMDIIGLESTNELLNNWMY